MQILCLLSITQASTTRGDRSTTDSKIHYMRVCIQQSGTFLFRLPFRIGVNRKSCNETYTFSQKSHEIKILKPQHCVWIFPYKYQYRQIINVYIYMILCIRISYTLCVTIPRYILTLHPCQVPKRGPHYCARVDTKKFDIIVGRLSVDISVATHNIVALGPLCRSRRRDRKTIRRRGGFWLARSPRRQLRTY